MSCSFTGVLCDCHHNTGASFQLTGLAADLRKQLEFYQSERPFRDVDETNQVPSK